jgi:hypothetical protein
LHVIGKVLGLALFTILTGATVRSIYLESFLLSSCTLFSKDTIFNFKPSLKPEKICLEATPEATSEAHTSLADPGENCAWQGSQV